MPEAAERAGRGKAALANTALQTMLEFAKAKRFVDVRADTEALALRMKEKLQAQFGEGFVDEVLFSVFFLHVSEFG